ncbi:MAG: lysophospholipid acyltransferase family protein [Saprospiraceae bacterium]|nr:lysophospholipid acyltransferase family protein [Saprospiraceae bacterium]
MLYRILTWLFILAVKGYFRSISIRGLEQIPTKGPLLLAANHTSAFMDPIVLGVHIRRTLYFLSRGSAFKNKFVAALLGKLHMIPVFRPEFEPEDVGRNEATFAKCYDHLSLGKVILIFPEGISKTERRLRPLKTGIARIGLGAEARNDFQLGVSIVPIGINYSNPHQFQSDVFVNVGRPIQLQEFKTSYIQDEKSAVREVMQQLQSELEKRTVIIGDERLEELIGLIEKLYRSELRDDDLPVDKLRQDFYLSKDIVAAVQWYDDHYPKKVMDFDRRIRSYLHQTDRLNLRDSHLKTSDQRTSIFQDIVSLILGFPLFFAGWIANVIPFKLAEWVSRKIRVREDFVGSIRLAAGMFVFLFIYLLEAAVITWLTSWTIGLTSLLLFYPSGVYTLHYLKAAWQFRYSLDYLFIWQKRKRLIERLRDIRQELIGELEEGREKYLSEIQNKMD